MSPNKYENGLTSINFKTKIMEEYPLFQGTRWLTQLSSLLGQRLQPTQSFWSTGVRFVPKNVYLSQLLGDAELKFCTLKMGIKDDLTCSDGHTQNSEKTSNQNMCSQQRHLLKGIYWEIEHYSLKYCMCLCVSKKQYLYKGISETEIS